jgi:hypothetical protein
MQVFSSLPKKVPIRTWIMNGWPMHNNQMTMHERVASGQSWLEYLSFILEACGLNIYAGRVILARFTP